MQRRDFLIESGQAALGFSALYLSGCSGPRDPFLESLVAGWEAGLPQWLKESKMPAVSIAIIRDGRLAWRRAFGVKDTGTNEPVDNDTVFAACSNTKPVFAYGVLKLCEKGVLNLDTPLTKYTKRRITKDPRIERRSGFKVMMNGDAYIPFLMTLLTDPAEPPPSMEKIWPDFVKRFFGPLSTSL